MSARLFFFSNWKSSKSFPIYLWEKNPYISGPMQFKPMLFKGQLYITEIYNLHRHK